MIMEKKLATPAEILCKGYPNEMVNFINYSRNLKFEDKPDYTYLKNLLKSAMKENNLDMDFVYDWSKKSQNKIETKESSSEPKKKSLMKEERRKEEKGLNKSKANPQKSKLSHVNGLQKSSKSNVEFVQREKPKLGTTKK